MKGAKILYGVCGIGRGHTYRQLPIVRHLAKGNQIVIFGYGESFNFYSSYFRNSQSVSVEPVSVPFFAGNAKGLDFARTAEMHNQLRTDHFSVNCSAMRQAQSKLGKPDLVISDYEPVCAQFAYANDSPLITIDQQSKYLFGDFPKILDGETYQDEVSRLLMFFPRSQERYACSFFKVKPRVERTRDVEIFAPILSSSIRSLKRRKIQTKSHLVYLSSQLPFVQSISELPEIFKTLKDQEFHVFLPGNILESNELVSAANVRFYRHGNSDFSNLLANCDGVITTGGHNLLSECLHLHIPSFVIPLPVYEQQMNARVIDQNGFGVSHQRLSSSSLKAFIEGIPDYEANIRDDRDVLLRGSSESKIISLLERFLS